MSNSVSKFIGHSSSTGYNSYFLIAESSKVSCNLSLGSYSSSKSFAYLFVSLPDSPSDFNSVNLDKDQITHLLSLDCPDAFIAYALTLCPCPPETAVFAANSASPVVGGDSSSPVVHDIYNIYSLDRVIVKQIDFYTLLVEHFINDDLIVMFILDICHLSSITAYKYPIPLLKYASRNQKSLVVNGSQLPENLE